MLKGILHCLLILASIRNEVDIRPATDLGPVGCVIQQIPIVNPARSDEAPLPEWDGVSPLIQEWGTEDTDDQTLVPQGCQRHPGWAPPGMWGMYQTLDVHVGSVRYGLNYRVQGSTRVDGQVKYYNQRWLQPRLYQHISFVTGNAAANVQVRFKGSPMGSALTVTLCS